MVSSPEACANAKQNSGTVPNSRRNAAIFIGKALLYSFVLMGLYLAIPAAFWHPVEVLDAKIAGTLLSLFGLAITINGSVIQSARYSIQIIDQCLAIDLSLLLAAFVLAYPSEKKNKVIALAYGVPAVMGANILRIIFVFLTGSELPEYFDLAHLYFGQTFMIVLLSSLYIIWILSMAQNRIVKNNSLFILKLIGYSGVCFIVWCIIHKPFVWFTETFIESFARFVLGLENFEFKAHKIYDYTFNFVTFTSLVLASDRIKWRRKMISLIAGNGVLFVFQLLFRLSGVFATGLKSFAAYKVSIGIFEVSSFTVPVLLWIMARYWWNTVIACPVCGLQKRGIVDHIKNKHGADALDREDVRAMFQILDGRKKGRFMD